MKKFLFIVFLAFTMSNSFAQPSGAIIAFGGPKNNIPAGWLACDGKSYPTTGIYKNLFNAIGTTWGNDAVNKFAVPDLRGLFLRGVTENSNVDPDAEKRDASRNDLSNSGNRGNNVGSKQSDTLKSHTHTASINAGDFPFRVAPGVGIDAGTGPQMEFTKLSVSIDSTGGNETRPKNAYVYYIIKL